MQVREPDHSNFVYSKISTEGTLESVKKCVFNYTYIYKMYFLQCITKLCGDNFLFDRLILMVLNVL